MPDENTTPAKVLIAEDTPILNEYVANLLKKYSQQYTVVGQFYDTESTFKACQRLQPDILILDLEMPGAGGFDLIRRLQDLTRIVVYTQHNFCREQSLAAGAKGFILKNRDESNFLQVLNTIRQLPLISSEQPHIADFTYSDRERQVMELMATGLAADEIAATLGMTRDGVYKHQKALYQKHGISGGPGRKASRLIALWRNINPPHHQ